MLSWRSVFTLLLSTVFCCEQLVLGASSCNGKGEVLVQKLGKLPTSNGCSKPAGISVGGEEDFTYCCDRHDACYSICGISKDYCEKDFGECLQGLCTKVFPSNLQCSGAAQMYQMGTTMFGGGGFQDLQDDFCECIPKVNVKDHYAKLLESVYSKHSDKSANDAKTTITNLLEKAGSSPTIRRLGVLFYKILKKYDSAIQHEGERRGMDPPRPRDEL